MVHSLFLGFDGFRDLVNVYSAGRTVRLAVERERHLSAAVETTSSGRDPEELEEEAEETAIREAELGEHVEVARGLLGETAERRAELEQQVASMQRSALEAELIKAEAVDMDVALAEQDILEAGRALVAAHPDIGAIVLECTNMPPHAAALQAALGLPVFDIYSLVTWFHAGLRPRRFAG